MTAKKNPQDQPILEEATEKGYLGTKVDPTPDHAYSVGGVTAGAKTPETVEPGSDGSTKGDPDGEPPKA